MTMKVQDEVETFTIKTKRKEHPNAKKYPGRPSLEFGTVLRQFLSDLTAVEREQFQAGTLVFEEELSSEFFDNLQKDDIVGVGLLRGFDEHGQAAAYKFKILETPANDVAKCRNITFEHPKRPDYKGEEVEIAFEDFSAALGMGFGEILERDGKPFGVSEEIELNVSIIGPSGSAAEKTEAEKAKEAAGVKEAEIAEKNLSAGLEKLGKVATAAKNEITEKKVKR